MRFRIPRALRSALCLFVVFALCGPAYGQTKAQGRDRVLDIQEVVSPGGIKAWLVEDHSLPIIALSFSFKGAGSALDPLEKQGLAQLVSNTMDEGAGPYDSAAFQKLLTDNNISLHFGAGRDHFGGTLKLLTKNRELGFDLLRLSLTVPHFDEEPVERMRAANLARIRNALADPEWKAARLLNDAVYAGHPYAMNSGGTLTTLTAVTADDLRAFARTRLGRDTLRVGAMGDIAPEELGKALDAIFGAMPAKADVALVEDMSPRNGGQTLLYKQDIPQTIVQIAQPGIGRKDPDYYTGMVMNFVLGGGGFGSRLTEEIREKRGLTYGVATYFQDLDHAKTLNLSTSTKNESAAQVLDLIRAEWAKMKDGGITDKELANAKAYLIGSFPLSLSSTDDIAAILLDLQLDDVPSDYLDKRTARLEAVTKKDVQALAGKLLAPEAMTIVLVGNPEGVTPSKIVDTLPNAE